MKRMLLFFLVIIFIAMMVVYFFGYTTRGTDVVLRTIADDYVQEDGVNIEKGSGNLVEGMTFENIELKDIKDLPQGSRILIQQLFVKIPSFNLKDLIVEVHNARILLPSSEPIVVAGTFKNEQLDFNIFSRGFGVNEVLLYLPDLKGLIPVSGEINDVDLYVTGNYLEPKVRGDFIVEKFVYEGFTLVDSAWSMDLLLKDLQKELNIYGDVSILTGDLFSHKTKVKIKKGKINFHGLWNNPSLDIAATSRVERTNITINLKGTINSPDLLLSSEPSYAKEKLMVMLATGKSWKSVEDSMNTGAVSADLTKDFIDYFFFAGKTNAFTDKFGIYDVVVKFDKDVRGIEARKGVSEKFDIGYGVEQKVSNDQVESTTQKVQGEYQVTEAVSVGVEKEIKATTAIDDANTRNNQIEDDKVYLKYKKSF